MTRSDRGNASVEFIAVCIALMVPIAYAIVAIAQLQSAVYGVNGAAQMAGRAFVQSGSESTARYAAVRSAAIAGRNHGLVVTASDVAIECAAPECLVPGRAVRITVRSTVRLGLAGMLWSVPLRAVHATVVDEFRQAPA